MIMAFVVIVQTAATEVVVTKIVSALIADTASIRSIESMGPSFPSAASKRT